MLVSFSPTTGHTLPDRYIEGTCPICGYPEARGDQCDNCGNQLDPTDLINPRSRDRRVGSGVPGDEAPVPRPAEVRGHAPDLDRGARRLAPERPQLLARAPRRDQATGDHPRSRLGRPDSDPGLRGRPEQADLRLVRRRDRLSLGEHRVGDADRLTRCLAHLVAERRGRARLLPGQGQRRVPHRDLAGDADRVRDRRRVRGRQGAARASRQRDRLRVPHDGGQTVLVEPPALDLHRRLPRAGTTRTRCATT